MAGLTCSANAKNHVRHHAHHHYTTSLSLATDSLSFFSPAFAPCAFCNTCSLLSSRKPADPISLFQAATPPPAPAVPPHGLLIAVRPIAAGRNAAPPQPRPRWSVTVRRSEE